MDETRPKVYVSIGSNSSDKERRASDIIFRSMETAGLAPRQMGRNEWTAEQPLRGIRRVIEECSGIVVIAFRRYAFPTGTERQKSGEEKQLVDIRMTTVWNQIEAALGYARGLPLLVIAEQGLLDDGLLEGRYDWTVYWTDFTPEHFQSDDFLGFLNSWKKLVFERENAPSQPDPVDLSKMSLLKLCSQLTVPQLWGMVSALIGVLVCVATAAFKVGQGKLHLP